MLNSFNFLSNAFFVIFIPPSFPTDSQNRRCHHAGVLLQLLQRQKFIVPVHVIVPVGVFHAECHAAGNVMHIGAAANGNTFAFGAGLLLIDCQQVLYKRRVLGGVMRVALNACFAPESLCGKGSLYLFQHCLFGGADRKANINTAGEHAVFYVEHAANTSEGTGFCVSTGNAQTAAVGAAVGEQLCQSLAVGKGGIAA